MSEENNDFKINTKYLIKEIDTIKKELSKLKNK